MGIPTLSRNSTSASLAVIAPAAPAAATSQTQAAQDAAPTAAWRVNSASEAVVPPTPFGSPQATNWHCPLHSLPITPLEAPLSHCSPGWIVPSPQAPPPPSVVVVVVGASVVLVVVLVLVVVVVGVTQASAPASQT